MNYYPSSVARGLRSGRTGAIALASSMPFSIAAGPSRLGFLMEIATSAAVAALTRGIALCLIPPQPAADGRSEIATDGIILVEPERDDPVLAHFEARGTPVVSIGTVPGRPDVPSVDLRSRETAAMLLDHLRHQGSRRVAAIVGKSSRTSQIETIDAYRAFAAGSGSEAILIALDEKGGEDLAYARAREMLRSDPAIDGLLVPVDAFASGAVRAARELGRAIPADLRIATRYDGLRAKLSEPPLTALDLHLPEVAETAVDLLLTRISGDVGHALAPVPDLVPRASTGRG